MQITDVRVRKVAKEGKLKAVVSITIDDEFVVHDIKVIEGEKGLFIAMPSKKALDGEYRDIAHPINSGTRERIQTTILNKYEESLEEEEPALAVMKCNWWKKEQEEKRRGVPRTSAPPCLEERCSEKRTVRKRGRFGRKTLGRPDSPKKAIHSREGRASTGGSSKHISRPSFGMTELPV